MTRQQQHHLSSPEVENDVPSSFPEKYHQPVQNSQTPSPRPPKTTYHSSSFTVLSPTPATAKNDKSCFYDSDCDSVGRPCGNGSPLETTVSEADADRQKTTRQTDTIRIDDDLMQICHANSQSDLNPFQNDRLTWQQNHTQRRPGSPGGHGGGGGQRGGRGPGQHHHNHQNQNNHQLQAYSYRNAGAARSEPGSPEVIQVQASAHLESIQ